MSKRAEIEILLQQDQTPKEIAQLVGTSYEYVNNIVRDLRTPGKLAAAQKRYSKNHKRKRTATARACSRRWKKNNITKVALHKQKILTAHQNLTKPNAHNAGQEWTLRDIEYLRDHGLMKSIHELALDLRRTYAAVQSAGHRFKIDLRGNKCGAGGNRYRKVKLEVKVGT